MENVRELPAESTRAILAGLGIQQRERARALSDLARLRKEARAEIHRLITFLDQSDPYVMTELEDAVDDGPCDTDELEVSEGDEEDGGDNEPSLGSLDHYHSQESDGLRVAAPTWRRTIPSPALRTRTAFWSRWEVRTGPIR